MRAPSFDADGITVLHGDCVEVMAELPACSVDAIVCDPPYGLEFMGKAWDKFDRAGPSSFVDTWKNKPPGHYDEKGRDPYADKFVGRPRWGTMGPRAMLAFQAWCTDWATEALRVLKPGGHLLAFGGTRTYHRLTCAIEDAGFEVRDCLAWLYGQGFPKSHNVGKAIDKKWEGWGTALKPAHEPIVMARKPLAGTVAANVLEHGTGALNVDGCRIGDRNGTTFHGEQGARIKQSAAKKGATAIESTQGRWPANVTLDEQAAAMLDEQSGKLAAGSHPHIRNADDHRTTYGAFSGQGNLDARPTNAGGASRFFYVPKASKRDRGAGNNHPTVKPVALMRWLVRLVTPPGGLVLDPFAGSGTTGLAARAEGVRAVLIEREADYVQLIAARLGESEPAEAPEPAASAPVPPATAEADPEHPKAVQLPLGPLEATG
jgi:DNA modification methylase